MTYGIQTKQEWNAANPNPTATEMQVRMRTLDVALMDAEENGVPYSQRNRWAAEAGVLEDMIMDVLLAA